jgi:hypothetical protein
VEARGGGESEEGVCAVEAEEDVGEPLAETRWGREGEESGEEGGGAGEGSVLEQEGAVEDGGEAGETFSRVRGRGDGGAGDEGGGGRGWLSGRREGGVHSETG